MVLCYMAPMRATVRFRLPSGEIRVLGHGALIGRLWSAELQLNDARVSEAHAMVSLRGRDLRLLALRGRFSHKGKTLSDLVLRPGQQIALASNLALEVVSVQVPDDVLALESDMVARQILTGVTSLFGGTRPRLVSGWDSAAADYVWPTGNGWMRGSEGATPLLPGDSWDVDGVPFRAVEERISGSPMTARELDYSKAIKIVARFDTVHLVREGEPVVVITGKSARLISELVAIGCPVSWEDLAGQLWGDGRRDVLRRRWDMQLLRLRQKFREHGIRPTLIRADGSGLIELVLGRDDVLVDDS